MASMTMKRWAGIAIALMLFAGAGSAQELEGALEGIVRDSSGGVVPGVTVATRSATGLEMETLTDGGGAFRFPSLPPGTYELKGRLTGFVPATVTGIDLRLGRQLTID